jgi:hypothetical protein
MRFSCGACSPWAQDNESELVLACGADAEVERTKAVEGTNPLYTKVAADAIRPPPKLRQSLLTQEAKEEVMREDGRLSSIPEDEREKEEARMSSSGVALPTHIETGGDSIPAVGSDAFDYDVEKGELFYHLENKNWSEAALVARRCPEQASYWISRRNLDGSLRWRMLPIHSAIIYDAPPDTLQSICAAFPEGIQAQDDRGVHPLQLAYRLRRSHDVVAVLEEYYVHAKTHCWPMKEAESIAI